MKVNSKSIEEVAQEGFQVKSDERNTLHKTCIALSSTKHLGAKKESLRFLGWEQASYVHDVDSKEESLELWNKLLQSSPIAILVMTTRGEVVESFIPDFDTFDVWCRTNDIKNEEYWVLPLGATNEKPISSQIFDEMNMGNSTRYKVNLNFDGLFQKKQKTLEKFSAMCFEGITPEETIQNAKGISLLHTGSNNNLEKSGVVRHFSSFKEVASMINLLQTQKCSTILLYLHKAYVSKGTSKKEDVIES